MRRRFLIISLVILLSLFSTAAAYASPNVILNGTSVFFDVPPTIEDGRTLVPLRAIFEAIGADVAWDNNTQTVTASKGGTEINLTIGGQAYKNGVLVTLDVPAKLIDGRTMVPLRFISEAFGGEVNWDAATQTIVITTVTQDSIYNKVGDHFVGAVVNKMPNGYGVMTYSDGLIIEGNFIDGELALNSIAKITFQDGSIYEGDIDSYGKPTGQGRRTLPDGYSYVGGFKELLNNGYGEATYPNGTIYKGYWKDGNWDGAGTIYYTNGQVKNTLYSNGVDISPGYTTPTFVPPTYVEQPSYEEDAIDTQIELIKIEADSQRDDVMAWYEDQKQIISNNHYDESQYVTLDAERRGLGANIDLYLDALDQKCDQLYQDLEDEKNQRLSDIDEWEKTQIRRLN